MEISYRAKEIKPSTTLAISALAKELKSKGKDIIEFGAGEPDFDTPLFIKEEGISAIRKGFTKYTPVAGIKELREVIVEKFKKDNGLNYTVDNIVVSCGAKHSLYNVLLALCDPLDEVILFSPYWVSYIEMIKLVGAKPVIVETKEEDNFLPNIDKIKKVITPQTKVIMINSPSNPTGAVYDRDILEKIGKIALEHNIWIISDEIYEKIIFDKEHISIAQLCPDLQDRTIVVNGVSKSYSMTGWRIGYIGAPKSVASAVANIQSHTTSNPPSISQYASIKAIREGKTAVKEMVLEFYKRRNFVVEKLKEIPQITFSVPQGAFYFFLNIQHYLNREYKGKLFKSALDLSSFILEEGGVALVPGEDFGARQYIRISFATSLELLEEGLNRIKNILNLLEKGR